MEEDLKCAPRCLAHIQRKNYFYFGVQESLRTFLNPFFTGGVGEYPLSHGLRRASSPKGTPLRYAASFSATAKSRPLGEGGCDQREQTEGVPHLRGRARCRGILSSQIPRFGEKIVND